MPDPGSEARIRDFKRRLELEPGSRLFVALAEEYRKSGRLADALSTLQKGLLAHPNYLSAQVALGRAYLEAGQITEAIATFSRVLSADPGNLVSAKSLADIYLSRGESVEAVKKYKLYRALSGDRSVDGIVERLEVELAPPPPPSPVEEVPPPPPPLLYEEKQVFPPTRRTTDAKRDSVAPARPPVDWDATSVKFDPNELASAPPDAEIPMPLSRDVPLEPRPKPLSTSAVRLPSPADAATQAIPPQDIAAALAASAPPAPPPVFEQEPFQKAEPAVSEPEPQGRVLADLYFAQGHYAEALEIYDDLVAASPHDEALRRLRRDAEARLLPAAATTYAAAAPDLPLERRLAKIRALKRWLAVVQTG